MLTGQNQENLKGMGRRTRRFTVDYLDLFLCVCSVGERKVVCLIGPLTFFTVHVGSFLWNHLLGAGIINPTITMSVSKKNESERE